MLLLKSKKLILFYALSSRTPFRRLPWLGGQYLDLYLLYRKVTTAGGWLKVGRLIPAFSSNLRMFFFDFFRLKNH